MTTSMKHYFPLAGVLALFFLTACGGSDSNAAGDDDTGDTAGADDDDSGAAAGDDDNAADDDDAADDDNGDDDATGGAQGDDDDNDTATGDDDDDTAGGCGGDMDCPGDEICVAGQCTLPGGGDDDSGAACASDRDCPGDQICDGGACVGAAADDDVTPPADDDDVVPPGDDDVTPPADDDDVVPPTDDDDVVPPADDDDDTGTPIGSCTDYNYGIDCQPPPTDSLRLIVIGDSISAGCCMYNDQAYGPSLAAALKTYFGRDIEYVNHAHNGDQTDDMVKMLETPTDGFDQIFGDGVPTITVFTIGGNDMTSYIGTPPDEVVQLAETELRGNFNRILDVLEDPAKFPGGNLIAFANVYDPADGTLMLDGCGFAGGQYGDQSAMVPAFNHANEVIAEIAAQRGLDMIDMYSAFLGHGWHDNPGDPFSNDPNRWFDLTCIHPTTDGHAAIKDLFYKAITGGP